MAPSLLFKRLSSLLHIALFLVLASFASNAFAQTVLLPGDVVVVSANADTHSADLIPLVNIEQGTELFLSNGIWVDSTQALLHNQGLKLTFQKYVQAGTNLHVGNHSSELFIAEGELTFDEEVHRLFAYQKEQGIHRFVFGLGWGKGEVWNDENHQWAGSSDVPLSLREHPYALLTLGEASNQQYYIRNGASGTPKLLQKLVADASNWRGSDEQPYPEFGILFNVLTPPVILFEETVSTVSETDSAATINVSIYEHDGSRLLVDVVFDSIRSIVSHEDLNNFRSKTVNFTGLIGDGVYEVQIPINNDGNFEGRETGIFSLKNLSKGNLGDFITHSLIIEEEAIPEVLIADVQLKNSHAAIQISSNEDAPVHVSDWKLVSGDSEYIFSEDAVLRSGEILTLNQNEEAKGKESIFIKSLLNESGGKLQLINPKGKVVHELQFIKKKEDDISNSSNNRLATQQIAGRELVRRVPENISAYSQSSVSKTFGWRVLPTSLTLQESFPDKNFYYWSEADQQLIAVEDEMASAQKQQTWFGYFTADETNELVNTHTASRLKKNDAQPLSLSISASDANENEEIDGLEGLNLLYNSWSKSLPVSALVEYFKRELSGIRANPVLYGIGRYEDGEISFTPLNSEDEIPAHAPFWVLIESPLKLQTIEISKESWSPQVAVHQQNDKPREEVGFIEFTVSSKNHKEKLTVEFSEKGSAKNIKNLNFYPALRLKSRTAVWASFVQNEDYYNKLAFSTKFQKQISVPIGFSSDENSQVNVSVTGWERIPEGWTVQVEDRLLGKKHLLTKGSAFNFEYQSPVGKAEEMKSSTSVTLVDLDKEHRFVLHITPPQAEADAAEEEDSLPKEVELHQNFPNPFNPVTTISFYLPEPKEVKLSVFNIVGQPVAVITEGSVAAGMHHYEWDATDKPSGMYIYQLEVGKSVITRKMTLVK